MLRNRIGSKPNENQKRFINNLVAEIQYWGKTNDIESPSHYTEIETLVDINDIEEQSKEELEINIRSLFNLIKKIK